MHFLQQCKDYYEIKIDNEGSPLVQSPNPNITDTGQVNSWDPIDRAEID